MKTKLAYMALGAIIASLGYVIGTLNNINAEDDVARVKELIVSDSIIIRGSDSRGQSVRLSPGRIYIQGKSGTLSGAVSIDADNIHIFRDKLDAIALGKGFNVRDNTKTNIPFQSGGIRLSTQTAIPFIDIQKPKGKIVTLSIDNQASIKLSNGGLKSKTVNVE